MDIYEVISLVLLVAWLAFVGFVEWKKRVLGKKLLVIEYLLAAREHVETLVKFEPGSEEWKKECRRFRQQVKESGWEYLYQLQQEDEPLENTALEFLAAEKEHIRILSALQPGSPEWKAEKARYENLIKEKGQAWMGMEKSRRMAMLS